ncbi:MAG: domain containing protein, partial [Verrucomicrobiales bacterium]|nr:domain containing protein [Verrucomicrobiales bacterium]
MQFDAPGHLNVATLEQMGIGRDAHFYLCGPSAFLEEFTSGLANWGVPEDRVTTEIFGS